MKKYKHDKLLTKENFEQYYYDQTEGVIKKKGTNKVMRSKSNSGRLMIMIGGSSVQQDRAVCWLNGVDFTPSCEIVYANGDLSDVSIENLSVKPFKFDIKDNASGVFKFKAKNDIYLPELAKSYLYDPDSGEITSLKGKVCKPQKDCGYVKVSKKINGKTKVLSGHRLAMYVMGEDIEGLEVDHIDGDRSNNKYSNLRMVTRSKNRRNSTKPSNNTSGISGVSWHKTFSKWEVRMFRVRIGSSSDFFEACCLRKSAENYVGGFTDRHGL